MVNPPKTLRPRRVAVIESDSNTFAPTKTTLSNKIPSIEGSSTTFVNEFFSFPCFANELAAQREEFLIFLRILLKHLELKDKTRHQAVKKVLRRFASMYREGQLSPDRHEGTLLLEMHDEVKMCVTDYQWQASRSYLNMFLIQRRCRRRLERRHAVISMDGS